MLYWGLPHHAKALRYSVLSITIYYYQLNNAIGHYNSPTQH